MATEPQEPSINQSTMSNTPSADSATATEAVSSTPTTIAPSTSTSAPTARERLLQIKLQAALLRIEELETALKLAESLNAAKKKEKIYPFHEDPMSMYGRANLSRH